MFERVCDSSPTPDYDENRRIYATIELTPEEREEVIRLNKTRGTYPLIEYRNSPCGKSDERAHKIELNQFYGGKIKRIRAW